MKRACWPLLLLLLALSVPASATPGSIRVVDAANGAAIRDAIVTVGKQELHNGGDGSFQVDRAATAVLARAPGYLAASVTGTDLDQSRGILKLKPFAPRALYLTVYGVGSKTLLNGALTIIRRGGANALVIDLKGDRGIVPFPSKVPLAATVGARKVTTIPDLTSFARRMHAAGIYLIARIVTFKDNPLASARTDLAILHGKGQLFRDREGLAWADPFSEVVRNYNIEIAIEAAEAGFDEIQFDYLRFPDSSARLILSKPTTQANRVQSIADFLAEARRRLTPYNVFLAADIFGYVCWNLNDTGIGQSLEAIAPQVDYLSPMLYPSGFQCGIPGVKNPVANAYAIVRGSLEEAQRRLKISPKRFRPWLQSFRDYAFDRRAFDADEVARQTQAASDFGSDGWMLWNARNTYFDAGLVAAPVGH
jgi:hypothetical protein